MTYNTMVKRKSIKQSSTKHYT